MTDWFLSMFPYKSLKKAPLSKDTLKRRRIFSKASEMLKTQFDVTKLMRMLNLTSLLLSSILTKEEWLLLLYQRKMIIEPHTDDTDEESDRSFTRIFNRKINSKNPWDRIFALGKIWGIIKGLEGE